MQSSCGWRCRYWGRHYLRAYAERADCDVPLVDRLVSAREFADHHGVATVWKILMTLPPRARCGVGLLSARPMAR